VFGAVLKKKRLKEDQTEDFAYLFIYLFIYLHTDLF
jgi:hypothetical protein